MIALKIGDKVRVFPGGEIAYCYPEGVIATVIYIHPQGRSFTAEWPRAYGRMQHENFFSRERSADDRKFELIEKGRNHEKKKQQQNKAPARRK